MQRGSPGASPPPSPRGLCPEGGQAEPGGVPAGPWSMC